MEYQSLLHPAASVLRREERRHEHPPDSDCRALLLRPGPPGSAMMLADEGRLTSAHRRILFLQCFLHPAGGIGQ